MQIKKLIVMIAIFGVAAVTLTGCTVRTYSQTRDRVDQDLSGNRGYLQGAASPADTGQRKAQRTIHVVEFEFGKSKVAEKKSEGLTQGEKVYLSEVTPSEATTFEEEPFSAAPSTQEYRVASGDTLQKISQKFYGTTRKWDKIYKANRDRLKGPDKIYPGQIINIPLEELKEPVENLK